MKRFAKMMLALLLCASLFASLLPSSLAEDLATVSAVTQEPSSNEVVNPEAQPPQAADEAPDASPAAETSTEAENQAEELPKADAQSESQDVPSPESSADEDASSEPSSNPLPEDEETESIENANQQVEVTSETIPDETSNDTSSIETTSENTAVALYAIDSEAEADDEALEAEEPDLLMPLMNVVLSTITLGIKEKFTPSIWFSDGEEHGIEYAIEKPSIATVSSSGTITGKKVGATKLIITSEFGEEVLVPIEVKKTPSWVSLRAEKATIGVGETTMIIPRFSSGAHSTLRYTSKNPSIATIDEDGTVYAHATGKAFFEAKTFNNIKTTIKITVVKAPQSIALEPQECTLGVGQALSFKTTITKGSAAELIYSSDDGDVLSINPLTGEALAQAVGTARVRVFSHNGLMSESLVTVMPAPSLVSFDLSTLTLGVGETVELPLHIGAPDEVCAPGYSLKSSSSKVVSIVSGCTIKAKATGTSTLTASTYNGLSAKIKITVKAAPKKLTLPKSVTLGLGERMRVKASLPSNTAGSISYTSDNEPLASVAQDGTITAHTLGEATITATSFNGKKASCIVSVKPAPTYLTLDKPSYQLAVGEKLTLKASIDPESAGTLSFSVGDAAVATINASTGEITGRAYGSTRVYVRSYNGLEAVAELTVMNAPTKISFQEKKLTLLVGDRYQLLPPVLGGTNVGTSGFSYKSSNNKIAKVNSDGVVTAVKAGTAKITVSCFKNKSASITISVKNAPSSIQFTASYWRMCVDEEYTPALKPVNGANYSYQLTSSDPAVAEIVDSKRVRAISSGTATITATSFNGKSASMTMSVYRLPEWIELHADSATIGVTQGTQLRVVMPEGADSALEYESLTPELASVDQDGYVQALSKGEACIRVRALNGTTGDCNIHIRPAPSRVSFAPHSSFYGLDEGPVQLRALFGSEEELGSVTFIGNDPKIANVTSDGKVEIKACGTLRVDVVTNNGLHSYCYLQLGDVPTSVSFAKEQYTLALGDHVAIEPSFDMGCESYSLESSDPSVIEVRGTEVYAASMGTATLSVCSRSGLRAQCTVEVVEAPSSIEIDRNELELVRGIHSNDKLVAKLGADGVGSVYYVSDAPSIARINSVTGEIQAISKGNCTIRAYSYDGRLSASCDVSVRFLLDGVRISIDPGHQGKADYSQEYNSPKNGVKKGKVSSGAAGRSTRISEHVTNLQISLQLRDMLEALGAEVYMTRDTADINISNQQRAKMMNKLGVDMVLRIHCNASSNGNAKGVHMYVRDSCAYNASVMDKDAVLAAERLLAKELLNNICQETGATKNKVNRSNSYTGNNWSTVPCVLLELGYLSNVKEDKLLNSADYQNKIVKGVVKAICASKGLEKPIEF